MSLRRILLPLRLLRLRGQEKLGELKTKQHYRTVSINFAMASKIQAKIHVQFRCVKMQLLVARAVSKLKIALYQAVNHEPDIGSEESQLTI